uniref:Protein kinase domain-containing protein n=2 Tax=Leptocylindrus danicus TaxID=163516 RepID=A0A7S2P8F2_9STRA|mmetsp:Transcript_25347/g.37892  ORF Transcript_25347/g.37892 Transcript_25347/m.37892 type:complete len:409 (+) Transcript_25347:1-1227(+)
MEREKSNRNVLSSSNRTHNSDPDLLTTCTTADNNVNVMEQQQKHKQQIVHTGRGVERLLNKKYKILDVLGVGSTSTCHRCVERASETYFACKIIDKRHIEQRFRGMLEQFHVEIEALSTLQHPNIIHLNDVYITPHKIYIIMELMEGGELFDYVVERGTLTELEASHLVYQVTSALVYMHSKGIVHRDLKPENLLLKSKHNDGNPIVKIIDFGLSKCMGEDFPLEQPMARSFLGTRGYLAPEMLQRRAYDKSVDAWALGVIVFVLLCGCLPFDDDSHSVPSDTDLREKFVLRFPRWASGLSKSAKDLLSHLLDINPQTRYTAEEALRHVWVLSSQNTSNGNEELKNSILRSPKLIRVGNNSNGTNTNTNTTPKRMDVDELAKYRAKANAITCGNANEGRPVLQREASI